VTAYGEETPIERLSAHAADRRDKIIAVLRPKGPDFYLPSISQRLDD
jgi:hypothetical protein